MSDYTTLQTVRDKQYKDAWRDAPTDFLEMVSSLGLDSQVDGGGAAIEFDGNRSGTSFTPDMAEGIDSFVDYLVEKYGGESEEVIRGVAKEMMAPMEREIEINRSASIARMLLYLVKSESRNLRASLFSAMHAIPRLAAANGISSMRESAKICGVSPEWVRRSRNEVCALLEIPIPAESKKSVDACKKYAVNGRMNHWRSQQPKPKGKIICKNKKTESSKTPRYTLLQEIEKRLASSKEQ